MNTLISVDELADGLASPRPPVVIDVRWKLGGPPGRGDYLAGHIPGAVYADLDTQLASHGEPTDGRHPLPDAQTFQDSVTRWGIEDGDTVVVYDGEGNLAAARAWWLLRWAGISDVRLLDGALPAWVAAGHPLQTGEVTPAPGRFQITPGQLPTITADQAGSWVGILLDARAPERFRGQTEPIDPKAGHIPGAVNAPTGENLTADGHFKTADELKARFASAGIDQTTPVAVYCGSGVTAAHQIAALAIAGIDATLFPGSWSQWSNLDLPVATGDGAAAGS